MAVACSTSHPLICKKSGMIQDKVVLQAKDAEGSSPSPETWRLERNFWSFGTIDCAGARYGYLPPSLDPQRLNENSLRTSKDVGKWLLLLYNSETRNEGEDSKKTKPWFGGKGVATIGPEKSPPPTKAPIKNVISLAAFEGPAFFATSYNPNQWFANMAE